MTTGPVRASSEWLRLREPADAAARASELVEKVRSYLPIHGGATIHDLGCGTGSMARWLAVRLPGPQLRRLAHDRDRQAGSNRRGVRSAAPREAAETPRRLRLTDFGSRPEAASPERLLTVYALRKYLLPASA